MTYAEAIQFLYDLRWFGTKLGLTNTFKLAALTGNPQRKLRFVHVAGTNGKGSTCAMLESIYRQAGLRTGLFTSPHLVAFGERIRVAQEPISEKQIVQQVLELQPLLRQFPTGEHPTFFEVVTVMALRHFVEQNCELVIWETGLGGRLDSTNIVTPLASVITNVHYDHQQWLGETLASIASEKAGIIKPRVPVVTAAEEREALTVIEEAARLSNAPLTKVGFADTEKSPLNKIQLPLAGRHQRLNAALAEATIRVLNAELPVTDEQVMAGLTQVEWPGRLQLFQGPSGQKIFLDGAHNLAGADALSATLKEQLPGTQWTLVLGILRDKDWRGMCEALAPLAGRIVVVPVNSERTAAPAELAEACRKANPNAGVVTSPSLPQALDLVRDEPFTLVSGSLYLVGEALEKLDWATMGKASERGLNEWGSLPDQPRAVHGTC